MTAENYNIGKTINCITKNNMHYNSTQILNIVCSNYINDLISEGTKYDLQQEQINKLLSLINKLQK